MSFITDVYRFDYYFRKVIVDLLCFIGALPKQPLISVEDFPRECISTDVRADRVVQTLMSVPTIKHLGFQDRVNPWVSVHKKTTTLEDLQGIMVTCPKLESLSLTIQPQCTFALKHRTVDYHEYNGKQRNVSSQLQLRELQLGCCVSSKNEEDCLIFLTAFDWSSIEKLTLFGGGLAELLLPRYGAEMTSLRSLCIRIFPRAQSLSRAPEQSLLAVSNFLATKSLVELELDGFSKELPLRLVASTKLRKLRLHSWETDPDTAQANLRSALDIRELAKLAPNLEHLMLDVGNIGKLWQSTAILGVDVDVHLYQIFDALSQLRHLKILHFFPRYFSHYVSGRAVWQQAIEDDGQAVRIFKHLKAMRPSLELLILSSDSPVARAADIDPMSWAVCPLGDTILLRVRQAKKDYEQKQIWQGQWRLRTEIRRCQMEI